MAYTPRILIVEDEPKVSRLFERVLSADGYFVTAVGTARHAQLALRNYIYEVAIVDMSLPDADGPNVIREIIAEYPYMKALAVSGSMVGPMRAQAQSAGAFFVLEKPITTSLLREAVYFALDPSGSWKGNGVG